jgi:hypothetical protein
MMLQVYPRSLPWMETARNKLLRTLASDCGRCRRSFTRADVTIANLFIDRQQKRPVSCITLGPSACRRRKSPWSVPRMGRARERVAGEDAGRRYAAEEPCDRTLNLANRWFIHPKTLSSALASGRRLHVLWLVRHRALDLLTSFSRSNVPFAIVLVWLLLTSGAKRTRCRELTPQLNSPPTDI